MIQFSEKKNNILRALTQLYYSNFFQIFGQPIEETIKKTNRTFYTKGQTIHPSRSSYFLSGKALLLAHRNFTPRKAEEKDYFFSSGPLNWAVIISRAQKTFTTRHIFRLWAEITRQEDTPRRKTLRRRFGYSTPQYG